MNALDNPLFSSLTTVHRRFAIEAHGLVRFPPEVAPFLAIEKAGAIDPRALDTLVREPAFMLGPRPELPAGWQLEDLGVIVQMVCETPLPVPPGGPVETFGDADRGAVLELAMLVYPHYFRPRTIELGRYIGMRGDGRIIAMVGERMAMPGLREVSAVCTHPSSVGRGLARRLLATASNDIFARGETPFLHVSPRNTRAVSLYEQNGYRRRIDVPFWGVRSLA
jgi:ribosomal protein S18 acetylase RimI-like enzyme